MNGPPHLLARGRLWRLLVVLVVLIAGHGIILHYVSAHMKLSTAALSFAVILLVMKHLGLPGQVYVLFRPHRSRNGP
jgi:hypothetical protein